MKVITEERLKEIWENFWVKNILVVDLEESIMSECKEIGAIQEENGQIIVDELRPMSDAKIGNECLIMIDDYGFVHGYKCSNESDVIGKNHYFKPGDAVGWIPLPIYRPKDVNYITVDEFNILITRNKDVIGYINKISNEYKIDRLINSASANELKQIANNIDKLNGVNNETSHN